MKENILQILKRISYSVKKSIRRNRQLWIRGGVMAVGLLLIVIFIGKCACSKKSSTPQDESSMGVMTITVAPSPTPTEVPRQVSSDAAVTNGNVTMVNEYLVQKESGSSNSQTGNSGTADNSGTSDNSSTADNNGTGDGSTDGTE